MAPAFDGAGRLVATPGYHAEARLYYHRHPGFDVPTIPNRPTASDVASARTLIFDDLFIDFPFAAQADRAHALVALLLPFVRRMVGAFTPIHLIEATTPGSGKGLLSDLISIVATGRACEPTTISRDEDETRKKLTAILLRGPAIILLDNLRGGLDSSQLASTITADPWTDRFLGQTKMISLPNRATWLATGNNPNLSAEIARRCVRVRLEPKTDRPWERTAFKHPAVRTWAIEHRARLVHAVLVLVRHWLASGRPMGARTLGSFETWAEVMGGILEAAGVAGFLGNMDDLYGAADLEGQEWRTFVGVWHERFGSQSVLAGDLIDLASERDLLGGVLGDGSLRSQATRLGKALLANRDRQFGDLRIQVGLRAHNQTTWRVVSVPKTGAPPVSVPDLADLDHLN